MENDGTYQYFIDALKIFQKYNHTQDLSAEHDSILAGPNPEEVKIADIRELRRLGWYPCSLLILFCCN